VPASRAGGCSPPRPPRRFSGAWRAAASQRACTHTSTSPQSSALPSPPCRSTAGPPTPRCPNVITAPGLMGCLLRWVQHRSVRTVHLSRLPGQRLWLIWVQFLKAIAPIADPPSFRVNLRPPLPNGWPRFFRTRLSHLILGHCQGGIQHFQLTCIECIRVPTTLVVRRNLLVLWIDY
jgi:hypothetical protein